MIEKFEVPINLKTKQIDFILKSMEDGFVGSKVRKIKNEIVFESQRNVDKDILKQSLKKLVFISKGISESKTLCERTTEINYSDNPLIFLKEDRQVIELTEGLFQFQGEFLKVFRSVDSYFKNVAIKHLHAIDQENPSLWPVDLFKRINYFEEFPQQAIIATSIKPDHKIISKFAENYSQSNQYSSIKVDTNFDSTRIGLQPAVCDNCYYGLRNLENVENVIYTTSNKVFRNEHSESNNLDRLTCFTVRDIMFVGDETFVLETRQKLLEILKSFFECSGLDFSIEIADDPFFTNNFEKKMFQHAFELKYEILVSIPFLNKRIAVGSVNFHMDTFGKVLNIKKNERHLYSGCIGIGFERLLLGFYSQFGTSVNKWPINLRKMLELEL